MINININRPIPTVSTFFQCSVLIRVCRQKYLTVLNERWTRKMLKNAIAYAEICVIYDSICKFLHMWHNLYICDFENAIIWGNICDILLLAKYAIAYNWHP